MSPSNEMEMALKEFGIVAGTNRNEDKQTYDDIEKKVKEQYQNNDKRFLMTPVGKTTVRFIPKKQGKISYYQYFRAHRLGKKSIPCLKAHKMEKVDSCPMCQLTRVLYGKNNPSDIEMASQIRAMDKYYFNVIVREFEVINRALAEKNGINLTINPTEVKILSIGKKLFEKIDSFFYMKDYGDLTHVEHGFDFVIIKKNVQLSDGRTMPNYDDSIPRPRSTPIMSRPDGSPDWEMAKEVFKGVYDLDEVVEKQKKSYDDLLAMMVEYFKDNSIILGIINGKFKELKTQNSGFYQSRKQRNAEAEENIAERFRGAQAQGSTESSPSPSPSPSANVEKDTVSTSDLNDYERKMLENEGKTGGADGEEIPF